MAVYGGDAQHDTMPHRTQYGLQHITPHYVAHAYVYLSMGIYSHALLVPLCLRDSVASRC